MYVVTRGVMAAGMAVYAAIHGYQAVAGPDMTAWLPGAFALTAVLAVLLGVMMFATRHRWVEHAAAALAAASFGALVLSLTSGFLGVTGMDLTPAALVVIVAEFMVLAAWATERLALEHHTGSPEEAERDDRVGTDQHIGV